MTRFTNAQYVGIDFFIKELFRRVELGHINAEAAHSNVMHVLKASDQGEEAEILSFIRLKFAEWLKFDGEA